MDISEGNLVYRRVANDLFWTKNTLGIWIVDKIEVSNLLFDDIKIYCLPWDSSAKDIAHQDGLPLIIGSLEFRSNWISLHEDCEEFKKELNRNQLNKK
jgi:hypothetical protein